MRGSLSSDRATSDLRRITDRADAGFDVMSINHANSACGMQVLGVRQVELTADCWGAIVFALRLLGKSSDDRADS